MRYYCDDCRHEVPIYLVSTREPYEFWGETGFDFREFATCGLCGSYEIQEITDYEKEDII